MQSATSLNVIRQPNYNIRQYERLTPILNIRKKMLKPLKKREPKQYS